MSETDNITSAPDTAAPECIDPTLVEGDACALLVCEDFFSDYRFSLSILFTWDLLAFSFMESFILAFSLALYMMLIVCLF